MGVVTTSSKDAAVSVLSRIRAQVSDNRSPSIQDSFLDKGSAPGRALILADTEPEAGCHPERVTYRHEQ